MTLFTNKPKILGTFSNWKTNDFMKVDKFYDALLRNQLPTTRFYVK